jgi:hypothetical protein
MNLNPEMPLMHPMQKGGTSYMNETYSASFQIDRIMVYAKVRGGTGTAAVIK